jgi:hypothetical protein
LLPDWGACHSTAPSINAGLDIEMPRGNFFTEAKIQAALAAKEVTEAQLHESCIRIMDGWYNLPVDKRYPCGGGSCMGANASIPAHKELARKISAQSSVLVKNAGKVLPLDKTDKKLKVVLIGNDAQSPYVSGQGSGGVPTSNRLVSPLAAFQARGVDVTFEPAKTVADAVSAAKAADVAIIFGSAHSGEGHDRANLLFTGGHHKASVADEQPAEQCSAPSAGIIGDGYFRMTRTHGAGACCQECLADKSCAAYTFTGPASAKYEAECFLKDNTHKGGSGAKGTRTSGTIPGRHVKPHPPSPPHGGGGGGAPIEDVITAVGAVNKKTVVVAAVPGQILTDWRDAAAAIMVVFLPGEQ